MKSSSKVPALCASIAALVILVALFPSAIGAWFLNFATAHIARAAALPQDSPDRTLQLNQADAAVHQAQSFPQSPRFALARARYSVVGGDPFGAVNTFAESGAALSADAIAQFDWANAAWQLNQTQVAFEHWRAAGAQIYFTQQMHRAAIAHQWDDAEKYARIVVGIDSSNADAHFFLGDALSHKSIGAAEALNEIDRAAELTRDPEFLSTVLSRKGEILVAQGNLSLALDVFQQARAVAPIDARPRTGYALVAVKLDASRYTESISLLQHIVGDSPWYSAAYIALADLFESRDDVRAAEEWYRSGLARNPNDGGLYIALGKFYAREHRTDEARTTLIQALKNETHWDDLQAIARALAELPTQ